MLAAVWVAWVAAPSVAKAQAPSSSAESWPETLIVGTMHAPPFSMKNNTGAWTGLSVELWESIADELGVDYAFREAPLDQLVKGAGTEFDVVVTSLTITAEREKSMDFTHGFYSTGLGIAARTGNVGGWFGDYSAILSTTILKTLAGLSFLLLIVGGLIWLLERRANPAEFGGKLIAGLGSGVWWSAVTMASVGYGDKVPRTVAGRAIAMIWMISSLVIVASFTATIASALTVARLETGIEGPAELPGQRVGTILGSTSDQYLRAHGVSPTYFDTVGDALQATSEGRLDATVYDAPILRFEQRGGQFSSVQVLPGYFDPQSYGFAIRTGNPAREQLNRAILRKIAEPAWQARLAKYLGN